MAAIKSLRLLFGTLCYLRFCFVMKLGQKDLNIHLKLFRPFWLQQLQIEAIWLLAFESADGLKRTIFWRCFFKAVLHYMSLCLFICFVAKNWNNKYVSIKVWQLPLPSSRPSPTGCCIFQQILWHCSWVPCIVLFVRPWLSLGQRYRFSNVQQRLSG